jgi:hypothetical protein
LTRSLILLAGISKWHNRGDLGGWDHRGSTRATNVLSPITSLS